jgi:hypothetical protein
MKEIQISSKSCSVIEYTKSILTGVVQSVGLFVKR